MDRGFANPLGHLVADPGPLPHRIPRIKADPAAAPYLLRLAVLRSEASVIGSAGFHDRPDASGMIEIGLGVPNDPPEVGMLVDRLARETGGRSFRIASAVVLAGGLMGILIRDSQADVGRIGSGYWYALMTAHGIAVFVGWGAFAVMGLSFWLMARLGYPLRAVGRLTGWIAFWCMAVQAASAPPPSRAELRVASSTTLAPELCKKVRTFFTQRPVAPCFRLVVVVALRLAL